MTTRFQRLGLKQDTRQRVLAIRGLPFRLLAIVAVLVGMLSNPQPGSSQDLSPTQVRRTIKRAKDFLVKNQESDGSWSIIGPQGHKVGTSSLVLLSLLNAGMPVEDEPVRRALAYLRSIDEPEPARTYEISLMIMALAAAKDGTRDTLRIATMAGRLEKAQKKRGEEEGCWGYFVNSGVGGFPNTDRSNGQFAVLGLRDAAHAGAPVSRATWERARRHWLRHQNADGGWAYRGRRGGSSGSMTVAGLSTLVITNAMLHDDGELNADGSPVCCDQPKPDKAMERAVAWLSNGFTVGSNRGTAGGQWLLYYLYGLERAGRLSGHRFFGDHDWYREGAKFLVNQQNRRVGSWKGVGIEGNPIIATSLALLFLSKGNAPVLINKLKYGPAEGRRQIVNDNGNWNQHRYDIRNLTDQVTTLEKWPKLLTWQVVDLNKAVEHGGVEDLLQAPIAYLSGVDSLHILNHPEQIELLKEFVNQGGFLFAVANCNGSGFEDSFRTLVERMFPNHEARLKPLKADHPIYRSEYLLDPDTVEFEGVDFGCRTAIVYSPEDFACLWDKWAIQDPPDRPLALQTMIRRANRIGVNVIAYATGRELADKVTQQEQVTRSKPKDTVERGLLEIAKLRHSGGWDTAPRALRNLLTALNQTAGMASSMKPTNLPASDPAIFEYPIVYMHGRNQFEFSKSERVQLRKYLDRGGLLFADACCGSRKFDKSFRDLIKQLYPNRELERIPASNDMFTSNVGHDIRRVKRRVVEVDQPTQALSSVVVEGEPFLEGIEVDGRYAVIYSKYDISCALERQASVACTGYVAEDAVRIAVNVVLYALLQDVRYARHAR